VQVVPDECSLMTSMEHRLPLFSAVAKRWNMGKIHERLRLWVRVSQNREPSPSEAIMDSQSVETATMVSKDVGYDSGKKIKGRKRHILVDTLGLLIVVFT